MGRDGTRSLGLEESAAALAWVAQHTVGKWEFNLGIEKLLVVDRGSLDVYTVRKARQIYPQINSQEKIETRLARCIHSKTIFVSS